MDRNQDYQNIVDKAVFYICNNLKQNLKLKDIAKAVNLSPFHFHRVFMQIKGESPNSYMQKRRVELAEQMIRLNKNEYFHLIAEKCGFSSHARFISAFKKYYGMTPFQYRKNLLNK